MALIFNNTEVEEVIYDGKVLDSLKIEDTVVYLHKGVILDQLSFYNQNITSLNIEKR